MTNIKFHKMKDEDKFQHINALEEKINKLQEKINELELQSMENREKELLNKIEKLKGFKSGDVLPTQEYLKEIFDYKDGELIWKIKRSGTKGIGSVAGSMYSDRYKVVQLNGKRFGVHRLVWIWHNGDIFDGLEIDHIDGNRANNRIENLRNVSRQENSFNRTTAKGYCWDKSVGKWKAYIKIGDTSKHLGHYESEDDADLAYRNAKKKYHNIGIEQTCENCKHYTRYNYNDMRCALRVIENGALENNSPDFSCNKWQSKSQ